MTGYDREQSSPWELWKEIPALPIYAAEIAAKVAARAVKATTELIIQVNQEIQTHQQGQQLISETETFVRQAYDLQMEYSALLDNPDSNKPL